MTSVPATTGRRRRRSDDHYHRLRRQLVAAGVPDWKVAQTPNQLLNRLDRTTTLRLVPDVDAEFDRQVLDLAPRLAWRRMEPAPSVLDETPDEAASTLTFRIDAARERAGAARRETPVEPIGLGAGDWTPWDEYHGPDGGAA